MRRRRSHALRKRYGRSANADRWILLRDGKEVMRGSSFDVAKYIHRNHSYSLDHALKYEGYKMVKER